MTAPVQRHHLPDIALPPTWVMAAVLVAVAANLRSAMASVPPLVEAITRDLGLSNAAAGALTTLPVLCMGVFAPAAQWLSARIGAVQSVLAATVCVGLGSFARLWGGNVAVLYAATFVAGVGIAVAGALLPRLVKTLFPPERSGTITGLYMFAMMGGATASAALAVPLADRLGSWQASLASWSILALVGAAAWAPFTLTSQREQHPEHERAAEVDGEGRPRPPAGCCRHGILEERSDTGPGGPTEQDEPEQQGIALRRPGRRRPGAGAGHGAVRVRMPVDALTPTAPDRASRRPRAGRPARAGAADGRAGPRPSG